MTKRQQIAPNTQVGDCEWVAGDEAIAFREETLDDAVRLVRFCDLILGDFFAEAEVEGNEYFVQALEEKSRLEEENLIDLRAFEEVLGIERVILAVFLD